MRCNFLLLITLTVLLYVTNAIAADKVVVIPLNSAQGSPGGVQVVTSKTGRVWMDRNLGALRSAMNKKDSFAYGVFFQWGRLNDGHAWLGGQTTTISSATDVPGHDSFITTSDSPYDWRSTRNDALWQGVSGKNNPCPSGFRIPSGEEWNRERLSWSSNDADGAFDSPLKLVAAGTRYISDGSHLNAGIQGYYWSSTVDQQAVALLYFNSNEALMSSYARGHGFSVRCIKN